MGLSVRSGSDKDIDAVFEIDTATWSPRVSPGAKPERPHALSDRHDLLVAEIADEVVGYLKLTPATPLESNAHVRHIIGLAVRPDHQRRGVAHALLSAAVAQARSAGWTKLSLRVLAPNLPARRVYEACGFETEGILRSEFRIDGEMVDDVLMAQQVTALPTDVA